MNYKDETLEDLQSFKEGYINYITEKNNTIEYYQRQIKEAQKAIEEAKEEKREIVETIKEINSEIKNRQEAI